MSKVNGEYVISVSQLRRMRDARMGPHVIAKALGTNASTVRTWLVKFGLPTKLPPIEFTDEQIEKAIKRHQGKSV